MTVTLTARDHEIEAVRGSYRPERILTLFVGESAPASGSFFYFSNTAFTSHIETAVAAYGLTGPDFLKRFKSYGWYLDDLVLRPVDKLDDGERKIACIAAEPSLAQRIAQYQPQAIVSLLQRIRPNVARAALAAGCHAPCYGVHFPGFGNQPKFHAEMRHIIPKLSRVDFGDHKS